MGENLPPTKKLTVPPLNGYQIECSKSFDRDSELQIYHGYFLLTDNKHWKLFVIKQSNGCKFMPKRTKIPKLAVGLYINILALEMASPGNQHCASCIGTLSFRVVHSWVDVTARCRSSCPSACLSQHDGPTAANPLLQVCCCGPGRQEISIDCSSSGGRMRAVPRCQRT